MKNVYIIIFFLSLSFTCNSQKLIPVKISNNLSLILPNDYEEIDTLGTKNHIGTIDKGLIVVVSITDTKGQINDKAEIETFLKSFQKGMVEQVNGTVASETIFEFESIKINKVTMITDIPNMIQCNSYTFRINSTTYSIQFIYNTRTEETLEEKQIIKSLKVNNE